MMASLGTGVTEGDKGSPFLKPGALNLARLYDETFT